MSIFLGICSHFQCWTLYNVHPKYTSTQERRLFLNTVNKTYLLKLHKALERVKYAQLGMDKELRPEYRYLEKELIKKIKEVKSILQKNTQENMV